MDKFDEKYRIESHRLYGYDYSRDGIYFITLVVNGRERVFGDIQDGKMFLSEFGCIVKEEWLKSFQLRQELLLDEFVIMPNHIHGLVVIKSVEMNSRKLETHGPNVETHGRASLKETSHEIENSISWQTKPIVAEFKRKPKSISSFVAGFKSTTISVIDDFIDAKELGVPKYNSDNKLWQANYHDRIIRNEKEYWQIKNYIKTNPKNWKSDDLNM